MGYTKRIPRLQMNEWFGDELVREFTKGEFIGRGHSRVVLTNPLHDDSVVKLEVKGCAYTNIAEYAMWTYLQDMEVSKFLAPCLDIGHGGTVLVQKRTQPISREDLPEKIPAFLTDLKLSNWGRLPDGRVVCHDYASAFPHVIQREATMKMKKAKWHA